MPTRFLCLLISALVVGGCATGRPRTANRDENPNGDSGAIRSGGDAAKTQPQVAADENAATEVVEEKYPSGELWKRAEGKRTKTGEFVPHGLTTTWSESGLKWSETNFRNGVKHGPKRSWYTTGAEWSYGGYDDGMEDGTWTTYHPNGEKAREWHMDRGVWDGTYTEWHPNGRKRMEVTFVKGLRQGVMDIYDENGAVAGVTDFIDGVEQP